MRRQWLLEFGYRQRSSGVRWATTHSETYDGRWVVDVKPPKRYL